MVIRMVGELKPAYGWTKEMLEEAYPYSRSSSRTSKQAKSPVRILLVSGPMLISNQRNAQMSTDRYKAMAREHVQKWCPERWRRWKQEDTLDESLQGLANQAQAE